MHKNMEDCLNNKARNFPLLNIKDKIKERTRDIKNIIIKENEVTKHRKMLSHKKRNELTIIYLYNFYFVSNFTTKKQHKIFKFSQSNNFNYEKK